MGTLGVLLTLVVRLYDNGTLGEADRAIVIATASEILLASNVPTTWPDCTPGHSGPAPLVCDRPMDGGEVAIRLVRGTTPSRFRGDLPLGYSLIDVKQQRGALATIYLDRVEWIAADAGIDPRVVLGRAIAHEIGHLLLGTNDHSTRGLMRALWSRQAFEQNRPADWLFTAHDGEELVRALGRRVPVAHTAENIVWGTK